MAKQRAYRSASLVVRAFVDGPQARVLVRLLEVDPSGEDRLVGVTLSKTVAARMVGQWLDSLSQSPPRPAIANHEPASS